MFGEPLLEFETLDSTNRYATEWIDAPHGGAVLAHSQTQGRGRLGRSWQSPAGKGLYLSVILHRDGLAPGQMALGSALAVARAVEFSSGIKVKIKWPNDILAADASHSWRKIGGILCEARALPDGQRLVVGIGLNLNHDEEDFPERPQFPASSLMLLTGRRWDTARVLPTLLAALGEVDQRLASGGWDAVLAEINARCCGVGEVVKVSSAGEAAYGMLEKIDGDGCLVIRTADGVRTVLAGDVSYL